jgi:ABC-type transport system involved in multi-copper enzyme maturation permease subunit
MSFLADILQYLWRLVPGNPILRRVVATNGKRRRDLFIRCGYLGALILVVILVLLSSAGGVERADLAALTKRSGQIFLAMSYVQLALVALLAPIFTAGAITQEKDSQTYDILLATPLTNGQIVLGSLLSRLFFVVALLVSGIPIFSITQIFGGVAIQSIVRSFAIAAATAFVTGALAMAISVLKVGTRRTIFSFYLFIALYMGVPVVLEAMGFEALRVAGPQKDTHISWLTGINPFLSLRVIFNDGRYVPPDPGQESIAGYPAIVQWYLSNPHGFYVTSMFVLSFVLVLPSVVFLRRLAQANTGFRSWLLRKLRLSSGDRTRTPRHVWVNPVAWREAKTKASAARAVLLRYAFAVAGSIAAVVLLVMYAQRVPADRVIASEGYNSQTRMLSVLERGAEGDRVRTFRIATEYRSSEPTQIQMRQQTLNADRLRPGMVVTAYTPTNARDGELITSLEVSGPLTKLDGDTARKFLLGLVLVEFAVILLIVTQAAASTVTREKEDGTLDLLLSTPITSRYYVWGKLRGLVSFVLPLLAVPIFSIVVFIVHDLLRSLSDPAGAFRWIVFPEAVLILPGVFVIVCAFAAIVGMMMSLRCKKTVMAVMVSVGIVLGACFGLGACGYAALGSQRLDEAGLIAGAFSPFTMAWILIDPEGIAKEIFGPGASATGARILLTFSGWIVTAAYAAIVYAMYKSMVRNFDMTIRKQAN